MCQLIHDENGCQDTEGTLVPKVLNNTDRVDNFCLITYKDLSGICHHYINPMMRSILNTKYKEMTVFSMEFPYLGEHIITLKKTVMMSYQPLVSEEPSKKESEEIPSEEYSNAMKDLESTPENDMFWMRTLPPMRTEGISGQKAFHLGHAYSLLIGEYPNRIEYMNTEEQ
jgi:hypothetical protein